MHEDQKNTLGNFFVSSRKKGWDGLPILSVTLHDGLVQRDSLDRRTDTNIDAQEHLLVMEGDIAYNMMRVWQGALGRANQSGLVSPAYVVLRPKKDVDSKYMEYLFKTQKMIYLFWAYSYGITSDRLRLYFNDFKKIPAQIPSINQQKKIAKILSVWDGAITTTEQLLANSKQQKKALMQKLLTGKVRLLDESGVRFGENWKIVSINRMGKVVSGGTPDTNTKEFWDGGISWLTPTDVTALKTRFVYNTNRTISELGVKNSSATILPRGSLMVCTRATIGVLAISTGEICTNQGFKSVIPGNNFDVDFLYYLISHHSKEMLRKACGSTFLELSKKDFERLEFISPTVEEQKKIVKVFSAKDQEIAAIQKKLDALKQEKKALMQQLLTGKRRVIIN